jgi:hypothetical protein
MIRKSLTAPLRRRPQSATLGINQRTLDLQNAGRTIDRFGLGQSPFPGPNPAAEGLPAPRKTVAELHTRRDKANLDADGVSIGPGSKELIFLTQLCFQGEIILPSPCGVSSGPQALLAGRRVTRLRTGAQGNWRLSAHQLEHHSRQDTGVAILPGASSERPPSELTARLAYVNFDGGKAMHASKQIDSDRVLSTEFLETDCGTVLQGIDIPCNWINA